MTHYLPVETTWVRGDWLAMTDQYKVMNKKPRCLHSPIQSRPRQAFHRIDYTGVTSDWPEVTFVNKP